MTTPLWWAMGRIFTMACVLAVLVALAIPARAETIRLQGAGATFPQPLYERWVAEYNVLHPHVKISYQGGGSGQGIRSITDRIVAFGASDAPLSRRQLEELNADAILEFPTTAGGVVPAYNLPGVTEPLRFTGRILSGIFRGTISRWNDPALVEVNPGVTLPDMAITPAFRTDGSGTTFVFTQYLATQDPTFRETVGTGTQVSWPVGQGGKGNPGVAAIVQQTPGAIGYIEVNYATGNSLTFGLVQNRAGEFVKASPASISIAGENAMEILRRGRLVADLWNLEGAGVYPIASFTYVVLYRDLSNLASIEEARALQGFWLWATGSEGQAMCERMDYAPLSPGVRERVQEALRTLTFKGQPLLSPAAGGK